MALRFDNHCFYHIKKTGGNWVREILTRITDDTEDISLKHIDPLSIDPKNERFSKTFCVVRNPLDWYASFYRMKKTNGIIYPNGPDHLIEGRSFEEWVKEMIYVYPCGFVKLTYCTIFPFVEKVFKQESLRQDLPPFLERLGYKEVYKIANGMPNVNVTPRTIDTTLSKETLAKLCNTERAMFDHFGYDRSFAEKI
jgi:hypothetical protein